MLSVARKYQNTLNKVQEREKERERVCEWVSKSIKERMRERVEYESRWVLVAFEKHQNYAHKYNKNSLSGAVAVSVAASMASDWKDDNPRWAALHVKSDRLQQLPPAGCCPLISQLAQVHQAVGFTGVKNPVIVFNLLSASFSSRCLSFFVFF